MSDKELDERHPNGVLALQTIALPKDVNVNGDIFGGWLLSQMDLAGGMFAREVAGSRTVTVTIEKMIFRLPVHIGDTVSVYASLLRVGNTSMDVQLEVWAKDLHSEFSAEHQVVTEGVFRYVAINDNGRPHRILENPKYFTR